MIRIPPRLNGQTGKIVATGLDCFERASDDNIPDLPEHFAALDFRVDSGAAQELLVACFHP
jgi:hypothetical protein